MADVVAAVAQVRMASDVHPVGDRAPCPHGVERLSSVGGSPMVLRLRSSSVLLIAFGSAAHLTVACVEDGESVPTNRARLNDAAVTVELLDANGGALGACSGTLLGPTTVLTAGHCIHGVSAWRVRGKSGRSESGAGATPWSSPGSNDAQPNVSDIGLLTLATPIKLAAYPRLATSMAKPGTSATRLRRAPEREDAPIAEAVARLEPGASRGFPRNYLAQSPEGEYLDTGGAVLDARGAILGVVSGRGAPSGLLHIARTDLYATWANAMVSCATPITVRSWGGGYGQSQQGGGKGGGWAGSGSGGYGGDNPTGGGDALDGGSTVPGSSGGLPPKDAGAGNGGDRDAGAPETQKKSPECPKAPFETPPRGDEEGCSGARDTGGTASTSCPSGAPPHDTSLDTGGGCPSCKPTPSEGDVVVR